MEETVTIVGAAAPVGADLFLKFTEFEIMQAAASPIPYMYI